MMELNPCYSVATDFSDIPENSNSSLAFKRDLFRTGINSLSRNGTLEETYNLVGRNLFIILFFVSLSVGPKYTI